MSKINNQFLIDLIQSKKLLHQDIQLISEHNKEYGQKDALLWQVATESEKRPF